MDLKKAPRYGEVEGVRRCGGGPMPDGWKNGGGNVGLGTLLQVSDGGVRQGFCQLFACPVSMGVVLSKAFGRGAFLGGRRSYRQGRRGEPENPSRAPHQCQMGVRGVAGGVWCVGGLGVGGRDLRWQLRRVESVEEEKESMLHPPVWVWGSVVAGRWTE